MKKRIVHIIFTLTLFISSLQAIAQTFPVQVIPQVTPPPPVYLSDYANAANTVDKIKATILLTDLTVANRQVRLKLFIEGNGINTQSRDFVIGAQPIFLDGGVPLQLGTFDLAPYFELQNLQGISAGAYANTLPEGLYQFCFEVYDVLSGNLISRKSCANVLIFLNEPPFLNLPQNNINLEAMNPQNILFQWTPRHINVSNVEYEFSLVEIWDFNMDPQAVFLASPPIYETTTQATSLLYGVAEPQLLEGKRYAWRIRAKAKDGIDEIGLFSNNGYSEIFAFTYQGECAEPAYLSVEEVGTKTATFRWQGDIDNLKYRIGYRKAIDEDGNTDAANTFEWFENDTNREEYMVIDLEPDTMYEWRIGGYCADGTLTYSPSTTFTTMNVDAEAYYNCGIEPTIDIANQVLLETIQVGDVIKAGDFNVKIQEVDGTNSFTGKGYTTVGFLKNIKIALVFTNIQVNTSYQFVSGEIKTVYDPNWTNILDVDDVIDEFEDIVDVFTGDDIVIITVDYDITEGDINVDTDAGQIVITNPDTGETATYDYDDGDTYTITDESGDQFSIDENGNVTQTGTGAEGGAATAANTFGISDNRSGNVGDPSVRNIEKHPISFVYKSESDTKYALDKANNTYENEKYHKVIIDGGGSYYPIHKAIVESGAVDNFYIEVVNSSNYIKTDELIFKTVSGTKVPAIKVANTNTYKITLTGRNSYINEEAIITYKDTDGKQHVLSSFFIHHIKKFPTINVKVVLVNGASNVNGLQAKLDAIYKPTSVSFAVADKADEITIPISEWDIDVSNSQIDYNGSGLASDHPKELRAIKNYYKNERPGFDSKAYYLFVIDDSMPITKALAGFMPKKNQWGFLFESQDNNTNIQKKEDLSTIAAHELGHGVFALGHPFGEDESKHGNANTWLMDYSNGTELAYPNWARMSSDALQLYLFQDSQDGENLNLLQEVLSGIDNVFNTITSSNEYITYFTPSGELISIPSKAKPDFVKSDGKNWPKGSLRAFELDEEVYYGWWRSSDKTFTGYARRSSTEFYRTNKPKPELPKHPNSINNINKNTVYVRYKDYDCNLIQGDIKTLSAKPFNNNGVITIIDLKTVNNITVIEQNTDGCYELDENTVGKAFFDERAGKASIPDNELKYIAYQINQLHKELYDEFVNAGFKSMTASDLDFYDMGAFNTPQDYKNFKKALLSFIENKKNREKHFLSVIDDSKSNQNEVLEALGYLSWKHCKSLTAKNRIKAIKKLSQGALTGKWLAGDGGEYSVIRLIRSTPDNKIDSLFSDLRDDNLIGTLNKKIDDYFFGPDNYTRFINELHSLFRKYSKTRYKQDILSDLITNKSVIKWSTINSTFVQENDYEYNFINGSIKIDFDRTDYNIVCPPGFMGTNGVGSGRICDVNEVNSTTSFLMDPFAPIALIVETEDAAKIIPGAIKGETYIIPAFYFAWVLNEYGNESLREGLSNTLTIASFAIGIGEIVAAKNAIQFTIAAAGLGVSIVDKLIDDEVRAKLNETQSGKDFLAIWDVFSVAVDLASVSPLIVDAAKTYAKQWDNVKINLDIPVAKKNLIDAHVEKTKKALKEIGEDINNIAQSVSTFIQKLPNEAKKLVNGLSTRFKKVVIEGYLIIKLNSTEIIRVSDGGVIDVTKRIEVGKEIDYFAEDIIKLKSGNEIEESVLIIAKNEAGQTGVLGVFETDIKNVFKEGKQPGKIYNQKPRPDKPSEYLKASYITNHLKKFDEGAVRFTNQTNIDKYGTLGAENAFVIPKSEFDDLIIDTGGDLTKIEKRLGLNSGDLTNSDAVIAWVKKEDFKNIKIPNGNEIGVNEYWIPGGKTSGGVSEATLDLSNSSLKYTKYPF